jgi:Ca-activated chloride channel family protein
MAEFPYAVGPNGQFYSKWWKSIDEQLMKSIAKKKDGRYFRATSKTNWLKYMAK